jgi:hypothetical protein
MKFGRIDISLQSSSYNKMIDVEECILLQHNISI